jgi:hypothetical protein
MATMIREVDISAVYKRNPKLLNAFYAVILLLILVYVIGYVYGL